MADQYGVTNGQRSIEQLPIIPLYYLALCAAWTDKIVNAEDALMANGLVDLASLSIKQ